MMKFKYQFVTLIVALICLSYSLPAWCYPILISAKSFPDFIGVPRDNLLAYRKSTNGWGRIALQTDEMEDQLLIFRNPTAVRPIRSQVAHPGKRDPRHGVLSGEHRITIDERDLNACDKTCMSEIKREGAKLCKVSNEQGRELHIFKISTGDKVAFLTACPRSLPKTGVVSILADIENRRFSTEAFEYNFKSESNIFLNSMAVKPSGVSVLGKSELQVYLNPPLIPSVNLTEGDIKSHLTSFTLGSGSLGIELAFAGKLLGISFGDQVCCDISIYRDALYLPVLLELPVEGSKFNEGSGVFYGFNVPPEVGMQFFLPKLSETFDKKYIEKKENNAMLLTLKKQMLAVGFQSSEKAAIPFLASPRELKKIGFPKVESQFGVFYDITKLKKKSNFFGIWFYFGDAQDEQKLLSLARNGVQYRVERLLDESF